MDELQLTWFLSPDEKEALRRRIPGAAAWTGGVVPPLTVSSLRTPELRPEGYSDSIYWAWDRNQPHGGDQGWIEELAIRRANAVAHGSLRLAPLVEALAAGRILGHDVGMCTADQLACGESPFFDRFDNSAWDTWLLFTSHARGEFFSGPVWLAWVPRLLEEEVGAAGYLSSTDCFFWVDAGGLGIL